MLKPQDIIVLMKLVDQSPDWTFVSLSESLGLSPSAVHRSIKRAEEAGLYDKRKRSVKRQALLDFLVHAAKFVFPPNMRGEARGMPTAWAAPPLSDLLVSVRQNPPVWPDAKGQVRGIALDPIHPMAVKASKDDRNLRELLNLLDAIRIGTARERGLAQQALKKHLLQGNPSR